MPATIQDFVLTGAGKAGQFVQLRSNVTGITYTSAIATDSNGSFQLPANPLPGFYKLYTSPSLVGAIWSLYDSFYWVPPDVGDTLMLGSVKTSLGAEIDPTHSTYGAAGDAQIVTNGAMGLGSFVLTSVSGKFKDTDVGKKIGVLGANIAAFPLITTIASYQSPNQVTLAVAASTAVVGAQVIWGTGNGGPINAAITAATSVVFVSGCAVKLPPGIFFIDVQVYLKTNVQLLGSGQGITQLIGCQNGSAGLVGTLAAGGQSKTTYSNIAMRNLSVQSYFGHVTSFYNTNHLEVSDCEISHVVGLVQVVEALFAQHCQNVTVNGNYLHDCAGDGIQINSTDHFVVVGNLCIGGTQSDDQIDIDCDFLDTASIVSRWGTVTGNTIRHTYGGHGIRVEDSQYVSVSGNVCDDGYASGICVNASRPTMTTKFITVTGNTVTNYRFWGIRITPEGTGTQAQMVGITVVGNTVDSCGGFVGAGAQGGILLAANNTHCAGNYVSNSGKAADLNSGGIILYKSGGSCSVLNNFVFNNPGIGINVWNGDALQTYPNTTIAWNHLQGNVTDYNSECFTQAGVTLVYLQQGGPATFSRGWTVGATGAISTLVESALTYQNVRAGLLGGIARIFFDDTTTSHLFELYTNGGFFQIGNPGVNRFSISTVDGSVSMPSFIKGGAEIYPGDIGTGTYQTSSGLVHAVGVPSNANGFNNDFCFSDNHHIYVKNTGVWIDLTAAATSQSTPANPALTASLVGVMMGIAGAFTPVRTGQVQITISGDMFNSVVADGVTAQIRTGTGAAPANGVALTGTARGNPVAYTAAVAATKSPFSITVVVTGLTLGTAIWIDLGVAAVTGGNASVENLTVAAVEV